MAKGKRRTTRNFHQKTRAVPKLWIRTRVLALVAAGVLGMLSGVALAAGSTEIFLKTAIEGHLAEIQMGRLAQMRSNDRNVIALGQEIEQDHRAAYDQAINVAQQVGVAVPTRPAKEHQEAYGKLSQYAGKDFDKRFLDMMEEDHEEDLKTYQDEARRNEDGAVATYAQQVVPILQKHLDDVRRLRK